MMRKGSIVAANVNKLLIWIAAPDFMWKLSFLLSKERFSSHEANGLNLPPFLRTAFPSLTARCVYEIRDWLRGRPQRQVLHCKLYPMVCTLWFDKTLWTRKKSASCRLSSQNAINSVYSFHLSLKRWSMLHFYILVIRQLLEDLPSQSNKRERQTDHTRAFIL